MIIIYSKHLQIKKKKKEQRYQDNMQLSNIRKNNQQYQQKPIGSLFAFAHIEIPSPSHNPLGGVLHLFIKEIEMGR